jgi:choline dehydrogenase
MSDARQDSLNFDYVIIGGGSAGCVLANRLSADGRYRIALIEAGGSGRHPSFHIPVGYVWNRAHPRGNWLYYTEPEESSGNRKILWPRGKVLGGSSAINGLLYIRGQARDYDEWRDLGNPGWGYADVLPWFRRAEDQAHGADDWHGAGGPLHVCDTEPHPLSSAYIAATREAGFPVLDDFNRDHHEGVGYFQKTVKNGIRWSTANAYLKPARNRPNLHIFTRAHALKLVFDGTRAAGVLIRHQGADKTLNAAREIILSAGAIGSPALLQHSGIGDAAHIQQFGIAVHKHLPGVGRNLQDHYMVSLTYRVRDNIETFNEASRGWRAVREAWRYVSGRRGLLTQSASHVNAFLPTTLHPQHPDIQFHVMPGTFNFQTGAVDREPGLTCGVCQLRPESRGTILINSADPIAPPPIRPGYLTAANDRQSVLEGLRHARRIASQPALAPYIATETSPGSAVATDDDDALLDFARHHGKTLYHPTSTCKMGADADAVVDSNLKVHGIAGLRVVDASIMPTLISGNTNAPTIMIAEKAADLILQAAANGT